MSGLMDDSVESAVNRAADYQPGMAQTPFAQRYAHLKGVEIKTVGEAFSDFTKILGAPVNALYKNMMTDIVGTTTSQLSMQDSYVMEFGVLVCSPLLSFC